jgi:DNA polymerase III subunit epsilon
LENGVDGTVAERVIEETPVPDLREVSDASAIALDFETANSKRGSPCSIGIAWIKGGKIVTTAHKLIRPHDMRFDAINVGIHGIRPEDVENRPEFPEVWAELIPHINKKTVLAHNAAFDMSVLRAVLSGYDIEWPDISYLCTVKVARETWPGLHNYTLPTVADHLRIPLTHHDAASDAAACAEIAIRAVDAVGASGIYDLHEWLKITKGKMGPGSYEPCSSPPKRPPPEFIDRVRAIGEGQLKGKAMVFTGALQTMIRDEAGALVEAAGGVWQKNVRKDTDYLVVGSDPGGAKIAKSAVQMDKCGCPLLIDEAEFLRMVGVLG